MNRQSMSERSLWQRVGYARREGHFRPSPVRAVFEMALRPEFVSLAGGDPDTSLLPHELIAEEAARLLRDRGPEILQYGSGAGVAALPEVVAELMARQGAHGVTSANTLITTGSQMGIDLSTKLLCDPGDVVLAEGPTYVGAMGVFGSYEVDLRQVAFDADGIEPQAVAEAARAARAEGKRVRYLYVIPNHQNPTGVTLTRERRHELVEVCEREGILIVEDDPYAFVGFPGTEVLPSLYALNPEGVIYLGSFSKIFAPGLRVGWMAASPAARDRLQIAGEAVSIHPTVLAQELAVAYVTRPEWAATLDVIRAQYAQRCAYLLGCLEEHMPAGVTWTRPQGGFFTWLTLPDVPPEVDLLAEAVKHDLVIVPGQACFVNPPATSHVRLAYSNGRDETMAAGVERLAATLADVG